MHSNKKEDRKMHFTVPEGVQPGELLKLMTPRGSEVEVEVPADAKVGKSFAVTVLASSSDDAKPKREPARVIVRRRVMVPKGATPGQVIKGKTPAGREFDVAVPAGVKPGKSFLVCFDFFNVIISGIFFAAIYTNTLSAMFMF